MTWPWPQDSAQDRLRRIIDFYRENLMLCDASVCGIVDDNMRDWGQGWVCSETPVDVNRLMSAKEIAEEFGLQPWNVHDWARRHPDLIPKHKQDGRTLFRLGDVLAYRAGR